MLYNVPSKSNRTPVSSELTDRLKDHFAGHAFKKAELITAAESQSISVSFFYDMKTADQLDPLAEKICRFKSILNGQEVQLVFPAEALHAFFEPKRGLNGLPGGPTNKSDSAPAA